MILGAGLTGATEGYPLFLEMQGNGLVEPGMHIISTDPQWDHLYQQLNPGFTNLKLDQARMRLLDKYIRFDPEKAFGFKLQ